MDTSNPAPLANAEILRRYIGRRVRCVLKFLQPTGPGSFVGNSSDGQQITVTQASGVASFTQFVEVIGVAENSQSLRADICTNFGDNFDMTSYNQLCQMANSEHQPLFI